MREFLPKHLIHLANACPKPLYVVGGSVRDFLAGLNSSAQDLDICSPMPFETFQSVALACGFSICSVFKNTGTVKLRDREGNDYEYTCFRSDKYVRGTHVPVEIFFTDDILLDARRRDFTCNAVYYDIAADKFCDPLDGRTAIAQKRMTTVDNADKVFGEDGLRLLRLARQAAQLGFAPDENTLSGARKNADLILDISPERIFTELTALLFADQKYGNTDGAYRGLHILRETGVLARILPELALGDGMAQRADFHVYDVLEHSFRAVRYAPAEVRFAALLHDVGKPFCMLRDGNFYAHHTEGERIAKEILIRLKAPNRLIASVCELIKWHMYDYDCKTSESKLRRFLVAHYPLLPDLMRLKQADFSACTDDLSIAPTCRKWTELLTKMQQEGVPLSLKQLAVNGKDILELGIPKPHVAAVLNALLAHCALQPQANEKKRLCKLALSFDKQIL